jgi:glycerol-3-phosphate dehydrogenase
LDLVVVGGGINGAGIACDAAERGFATALLESDDFGSGTSSRSSKLVHGGLRYLEYYDFRLVRESLAEREALMKRAPHLIWPVRFVMPVTRNGHPAWKIRAGLFLYDHLARRRVLAGTERIDLTRRDGGMGFRNEFDRAFAYSDCRVDDARLVIANVLGAQRAGSSIMARTRFDGAERAADHWRIRATELDTGRRMELLARAIVNAAGPWAVEAARAVNDVAVDVQANLVRGSHILLPRLHEGEHATMLQVGDGRVVVTMPFEHEYTLVGTTDSRFTGDPRKVEITPEECDYLLTVVQRFFRVDPKPADIVWSYSGVRPLFEEGKSRDGNPTTATRDYAFRIDRGQGHKGAPILIVLGGKLTTYRKLAEHAVGELQAFLPRRFARTKTPVLPGGDIGSEGIPYFVRQICARRGQLPAALIGRYARTYGSRVDDMLGDARMLSDLGACFGGDLYEREVDFLVRTEWAASAEDILWRRTKCGLRLSPAEAAALTAHLAGASAKAARS